MIIRARVVVTMDVPPIENGAVLISGDRIAAVGKFPDITGRGSREAAGEGKSKVIDLGDRALLPGLINAHCHLDYTCLRGKISRQKSFADWIRAINAEKSKLSADDYVRSIEDGFLEAKRFGTTATANLTAFPELVSQVESPIRTCWFAELIDVRDPSRFREIVENAVRELKAALECGDVSPLSKRGHVRAVQNWGLAPHAPFTASADLYRQCGEIAASEDVLLTTHLAESREEMSMFQDASGDLYDFLKLIGRDMSDCGGTTPIQRAIEGNRPYLLVHLNELSDEDLRLIKKMAATSSVVHCPRSHEYFGHSPFQFEKLRDADFNICLGTDSLASNVDLSLFAEMRAFEKNFPNVRPEQILEMVTVNPADALRQGDAIGKIRRDYLADLIAIPITSSKSAFDEIIAFDRAVEWSMIGGRILN